jgi:Mlc titration factor MtfA (ptsG expression regulator)
MFSWLRPPHEDAEHAAWRGLAIFLVMLTGWLVIALAKSGRPLRPFFETAGVICATGFLLLGSYWLAVLILRRLPQDASIGWGASKPFVEPPEWTPILNAIPNIGGLPAVDRQRLGRFIDHFIRHVHFEGIHGLQITPTIRITIAAQACLLALNLPRGALGNVKTVLVYPTAFLARRFSWHEHDPDAVGTPTLGESWHKGTVILAWDSVLEGLADPSDGHNVALHEFAHQLDTAEGDADGIPLVGNHHRYQAWTTVLEASFARFNRELQKGREGAIDSYGATNPAEFFAVATESFFERPDSLKREYPELYDQLKQYYRQDRAAGGVEVQD